MPVKVVEFAEAPRRLKTRGTVGSSQDYTDVMREIRNPANKGKAFIVTLDAKQFESVKKPEISFAYTLRRYFEKEGTAWTAYQSGKLEVTVRSLTKAEAEARGKRK